MIIAVLVFVLCLINLALMVYIVAIHIAFKDSMEAMMVFLQYIATGKKLS